MPQLHFRYGAMNAGKTVHLLVALHQYRETGKVAVLIKPRCDTRHGVQLVWTRVPGLSRDADIVLPQQSLLSEAEMDRCARADCCFVEESQFLHPRQVEQLSFLSTLVPVICYGLRTLANGKLWPGAASLFAWADTIEEIKNVCKFCRRKSTQNLRVAPQPSAGPAGLELGAEEKFVGVCKVCFYQKGEDPLVLTFQAHTRPDVVIVDD